jgi:2-dehydropantoate 2-reductase
MRIVIFGTGALGGFFGARLARAGASVTFIARGETLRALRSNGLRVESQLLGDIFLPRVAATDDPAAAGTAGLVLLTVKGYDLAATAASLAPLIGAGTAVLPLLNGVEIAERMGAVLGMAHMLGGLTYVAAGMTAPGVIRHSANDGITLGAPPGGASDRVEPARAALAQAGIPVTVSGDIVRDTWAKAVLFAGTGGVLAVARATFGAVLRDPDLREMFTAALGEAAAVARRRGVALPPDIVEQGLRVADAFPPEAKSSMLRDVEAGRPLELEPMHGAIVRLGRELGVPTPACAFIYAALKPLARGTASRRHA